MKTKSEEKSEILDEKDKLIIKMLHFNSRESLTNISNKVGLSIDSVHTRIKKMVSSKILYFRALPDPKKIGFPIVADVDIKLHNVTEEELKQFLQYLTAHQRVIELITTAGDFDVTCVLIAKDSYELEKISFAIRQKFSKLIAEWKTLISLNVYKFEEYNFI